LSSYAGYLAAPFAAEDFAFEQHTLRGVPELPPRWKRGVAVVDRLVGFELGKIYVDRYVPKANKVQAEAVIANIMAAYRDGIATLDWMGPETRREALAKLDKIAVKIAYPEQWRDYGGLEIRKDDLVGNVMRARRFDYDFFLAKLGTKVDRAEWRTSPQTVNAFYSASRNEIVFPAGILQPPFFDAGADAAANYGAIGAVIGHEMSHGFDDEGSQFDAKGNLKNWWKEEDRKKFDERTKCVSDQYSTYVVVDDVHINGELTKGEDVADLGGEILAYMAWGAATAGKNLQPMDGLTPEQRFFVGFAQWACANERPEDLRVRAQTDPHSPPEYRINGVVVNMPEFQKVFSCRVGQPMVKPAEKICKVW
jgi:putative endopeptidase